MAESSVNEKIIGYMSTKVKDGEIILAVDPIQLHLKNLVDYTLVITSSTIYFLHDLSIKKYFKISSIEYVAMTPFSNEMVFEY